jgi:hypothetical protein
MYFTAMGGMSLRGFHFEMLALIGLFYALQKCLPTER